MHPNSRFSLTLVVSLALWLPTLQATVRGGIDPLAASLRWVAAFCVASMGMRLVGGLLDAYAAEPDIEPGTDPAFAVDEPENVLSG